MRYSLTIKEIAKVIKIVANSRDIYCAKTHQIELAAEHAIKNDIIAGIPDENRD